MKSVLILVTLLIGNFSANASIIDEVVESGESIVCEILPLDGSDRTIDWDDVTLSFIEKVQRCSNCGAPTEVFDAVYTNEEGGVREDKLTNGYFYRYTAFIASKEEAIAGSDYFMEQCGSKYEAYPDSSVFFAGTGDGGPHACFVCSIEE
ncbi:MAG: hypothetical protein HRT45_06040 [Bdellovibrionales bacterium]|nr:hypothetical protein [Bdellovibrionales bacterium]